MFDVDDPFDQVHGPGGAGTQVADVQILDSNPTIGDDNRGTTTGLGFHGPVSTGPDGKAEITLTVSMQPGDNYRAGASVLQDALNQPPTGQTMQQVADARGTSDGGYSVPLTWSPMLTVWRKLYVEVDSMASEPTTVEGRGPDWDRFDPIEVSGGEATTLFDGVGFAAGGPLAAGEVDHYEGGTLRFPIPSRDYPVRNNHSYFDSDWGGSRTEVRTDAPTSPAEEADILAGPLGDVHDDDPISGQLPLFYSVGSDAFIRTVYQAAYIAIEEDQATNPRRLVSFDLHLEDLELQMGVGYDNSQDVFSENAYWASLVIMAYQPKDAVDADPDPFAGLNNSGSATNPNYDTGVEFGVTVEDSDNASLIYVEVQRDVGSPIASAVPHDLSHTIAHEIAHAGSNQSEDEDHAEGGLMSPGAPVAEYCFTAVTLRRSREIDKW
jgi:hypothetical protein